MTALGLVIADGHGSPEFLRQALAWQRWHQARGGTAELAKLAIAKYPLAKRWPYVRNRLGPRVEGWQQLSIFSHGFPDHLQFVPAARVNDLAEVLGHAMRGPAIVTLYACSAARGRAVGGDGGFADQLRDALCAVGAVYCRVDAHGTSGHTTRNPYVRRFEGGGVRTGGIGGQWIVTPKSAQWAKWSHALKGDLRWEFPFLTASEIHARLAL